MQAHVIPFGELKKTQRAPKQPLAAQRDRESSPPSRRRSSLPALPTSRPTRRAPTCRPRGSPRAAGAAATGPAPLGPGGGARAQPGRQRQGAPRGGRRPRYRPGAPGGPGPSAAAHNGGQSPRGTLLPTLGHRRAASSRRA